MAANPHPIFRRGSVRRSAHRAGDIRHPRRCFRARRSSVGSTVRQRQRTALGRHDNGPDLRPRLEEIEVGRNRRTPLVRRRNVAAIGDARPSGNVSSAFSTTMASGTIAVRIEKALMAVSKMPKPPGPTIHSCPGCQRRISSFQSMWTEMTRRVRSHEPASATPAASRECRRQTGRSSYCLLAR